MPTFKVTCHVKVPFVTHVEAETEEEARKIAYEKDEPYLPDEPLGYFKGEYWVYEDISLFHPALTKEPLFIEALNEGYEEEDE